jgi:hypothetical protein
MKKILVINVLFWIFLISFASAKITISEPAETYSLGDRIYIDVVVVPASVRGFFEINLFCKNDSVSLYKIPAEPSFSAGEEQAISTIAPLYKSYIGNLLGECYISASLNEDKVLTNAFVISDEVILDVGLDKKSYNPGESITLTVDALKSNGHLLEGFLEASNATDFTKEIIGGHAEEVFAMPETAEAGTYFLNLFVYDRGENNEILNHAEESVLIKINQVASFIQTSLSELEITPGQDLTLSIDIFDQSGKNMQGSVLITLVSPEDEEKQITINSGEFGKIHFPTNAEAGIWKIFSSFSDIGEESEFEVKELQKAEFEFLDSILIIKNIGNTVYNKTVSIRIGDEIQKLENLRIGVGEEKRFNLKAPNGEYDVLVGDEETQAERRLLLTGKAVSINDLDSGALFRNYPIIWVFIILILAGVGLIVFLRFKKKTVKLKDKIEGKIKEKAPSKISSSISDTVYFTKKSPESQSLDSKEEKVIDLTKSKIQKAEQGLVLKGEKNVSAAVCIKIKNYSKLKENSKQEIVKILEKIKDKKPAVDARDDYVLIIFSPVFTKTFKNEILAVKAGFEVFEKFKAHNKKFSEKIEFNIGVSSGQIIASKKEGKLKYTSVGNTIPLARRISDADSGKLLVSDSVRKKLMRDLKVEKHSQIGKTDIYSASKLADIETNREKLKEILKRMEKI